MAMICVVKVRCDLGCRPFGSGKTADDLAYQRGLAHMLRLPANNDQGHDAAYFIPLRLRRASVASSFKYSFSGRAGVPHKTIPLPRKTFPLKTPLCPPKIVPPSTSACSPMPTWPPMIAPGPIREPPEIPV